MEYPRFRSARMFSPAESGIDETIENAKETIELWIETVLDAGEDVTKPSSIGKFQKNANSKAGYG